MFDEGKKFMPGSASLVGRAMSFDIARRSTREFAIFQANRSAVGVEIDDDAEDAIRHGAGDALGAGLTKIIASFGLTIFRRS